jgi:mono/diheme cytochrome c family protein
MKKIMYSIVLLSMIAIYSNKAFAQSTWKAPKEADKTVNPIKGDEKSVKKGKKIYVQMCVICHGAKGKGDGVAGAALKPKPANFTSKGVQAQSDGALFWKLTNGKAPMASYKELLTETQRWEVINYVRTLKK